MSWTCYRICLKYGTPNRTLILTFWYHKMIFFLISEFFSDIKKSFRYQKIIFCHKKFPGITNYFPNQKISQFSDIRNHFLVTKNNFRSDIRNCGIFWYLKIFFISEKRHYSLSWRPNHVKLDFNNNILILENLLLNYHWLAPEVCKSTGGSYGPTLQGTRKRFKGKHRSHEAAVGAYLKFTSGSCMLNYDFLISESRFSAY